LSIFNKQILLLFRTHDYYTLVTALSGCQSTVTDIFHSCKLMMKLMKFIRHKGRQHT